MINYFKECIKTLNSLKSAYPAFPIGRHISTATADYGDVWNITDKELSFLLHKYEAELEIDKGHVLDDAFVNKVFEEGKDLYHILDEQEEEEDY
jgi:hypothetical protein